MKPKKSGGTSGDQEHVAQLQANVRKCERMTYLHWNLRTCAQKVNMSMYIYIYIHIYIYVCVNDDDE